MERNAPQFMARETWRLLPYHCGPSSVHVALSDALVRQLQEPSLWWHSTDTPTLLLGAGQKPLTIPASAEQRRISVARRHAGGGAVLATSSVLGLDIALPANHPLAIGDVVEAYRWLGELWAGALIRLGVKARIVSVAEARSWQQPPSDVRQVLQMACFGSVSPYEVLSEGRKIIGLAQVRRRRGVLWQSGLHLDFDARVLAAVLAPELAGRLTTELQRRAVGLNEASSLQVDRDDVFRAFAAALVHQLDVRLRPGRWNAAELERAGEAPIPEL